MEDIWVVEEEVALVAGEMLEEMGPYLVENGGEAGDYQTLDTGATELAEVEVDGATDMILCPRAPQDVNQHSMSWLIGLEKHAMSTQASGS